MFNRAWLYGWLLVTVLLSACGGGGGGSPAPGSATVPPPVPDAGGQSGDTGIVWTTVQAPTKDVSGLHSVAFGNGKFVATGRRVASSPANAISWSTDGQTWRDASVPSTAGPGEFRSVIFEQGKFVAASGSGSIMTSADGQSWTVVVPPTGNHWFQLVYGGGTFMVFGSPPSSYSSAAYATSRDGVTWSNPRTFAPESFMVAPMDLAFCNGLFIASFFIGGVWASADAGATWTSVKVNQFMVGIAYGNGRFVARTGVGFDYVATSTDLISWVPALQVLSPGSLSYVNGIFLAGGFYDASIRTSVDGMSWSTVSLKDQAPEGFSAGFRSFAYGNGVYVGVGTPGWIIRGTAAQ